LARFWPPWRRPQTLERTVIVLYSRPGCHLCEAVAQLLQERQRQYGFQLRDIDIDADDELKRRYGECVPVVAVDGKIRFRGRVESRLLDRLLRGMTYSPGGG
jgi:glutaredoxin